MTERPHLQDNLKERVAAIQRNIHKDLTEIMAGKKVEPGISILAKGESGRHEPVQTEFSTPPVLITNTQTGEKAEVRAHTVRRNPQTEAAWYALTFSNPHAQYPPVEDFSSKTTINANGHFDLESQYPLLTGSSQEIDTQERTRLPITQQLVNVLKQSLPPRVTDVAPATLPQHTLAEPTRAFPQMDVQYEQPGLNKTPKTELTPVTEEEAIRIALERVVQQDSDPLLFKAYNQDGQAVSFQGEVSRVGNRGETLREIGSAIATDKPQKPHKAAWAVGAGICLVAGAYGGINLLANATASGQRVVASATAGIANPYNFLGLVKDDVAEETKAKIDKNAEATAKSFNDSLPNLYGPGALLLGGALGAGIARNRMKRTSPGEFNKAFRRYAGDKFNQKGIEDTIRRDYALSLTDQHGKAPMEYANSRRDGKMIGEILASPKEVSSIEKIRENIASDRRASKRRKIIFYGAGGAILAVAGLASGSNMRTYAEEAMQLTKQSQTLSIKTLDSAFAWAGYHSAKKGADGAKEALTEKCEKGILNTDKWTHPNGNLARTLLEGAQRNVLTAKQYDPNYSGLDKNITGIIANIPADSAYDSGNNECLQVNPSQSYPRTQSLSAQKDQADWLIGQLTPKEAQFYNIMPKDVSDKYARGEIKGDVQEIKTIAASITKKKTELATQAAAKRYDADRAKLGLTLVGGTVGMLALWEGSKKITNTNRRKKK